MLFHIPQNKPKTISNIPPSKKKFGSDIFFIYNLIKLILRPSDDIKKFIFEIKEFFVSNSFLYLVSTINNKALH